MAKKRGKNRVKKAGKKTVRRKPKKQAKKAAPKTCVKPVFRPGFQATPLKSSFMLASILGFFISVLWVRNYSESLAFAFSVVFFIMFIAAMVSMARAPPGPQLPKPRRPVR